ncbi:MAG: tetratricopeptide repeat protein [Marinifilaceae bacterium]
MYSRFIILLIFVSVCACKSNVQQQTQLGLYYMDQQQYSEAINEFTGALSTDRFWLPAYYNRAIAYANSGDTERALNDFNFLITSLPDYAEAYFNRAILYENKLDYNRAIQDYSTCISLYPDYIKAYHYRGILLFKMGNFDGALQDYNKAIALGTNVTMDMDRAQHIGLNSSALFFNRAVVFQKKGEYENAIKDYDQVLFIDPSSAKAYYNRGVAKIGLRQFKNGIDDLHVAENLGHTGAQELIARYSTEMQN